MADCSKNEKFIFFTRIDTEPGLNRLLIHFGNEQAYLAIGKLNVNFAKMASRATTELAPLLGMVEEIDKAEVHEHLSGSVWIPRLG